VDVYTKCGLYLSAAFLVMPGSANKLAAQDRVIAADSSVSVDLPSSFQPIQINPKAKLQFADTATESYIMVFIEPKKDLTGWNLTRHSMITMAHLLSSVDMPTVSAPRNTMVGGYPAVQYEIQGAMQGMRISYLHTTVESPIAFAQVVGWSAESKWTADESVIRKVVSSVQLPQTPASYADVFNLVPGTWAWESHGIPCKGPTQRFEVAPDHKHMKIHHSEPIDGFDGKKTSVTNYVIEGSGDGVLHTYIPDETRKTDAGDPVKWDLIVVARNRVAWHRADWPEGGLTGMLRRCPAQ